MSDDVPSYDFLIPNTIEATSLLAARVYLGLGHTGRQNELSAIVICHGLLSSQEGDAVRLSVDAAITEFDAVVTFDFADCGTSRSTTGPTRRWCVGGYEDEVEDLRSVVHFLRGTTLASIVQHSDGGEELSEEAAKLLSVDCILGHSRGATVVALYGCRYGDVPCLVLAAMRLHLEAGIMDRFTQEEQAAITGGQSLKKYDAQKQCYEVTPEGVRRRLALDFPAELRKLAEASKSAPNRMRICIVHSEDDLVVPFFDALEAFNILSQAEGPTQAGSIAHSDTFSTQWSSDGAVCLVALAHGGHSFVSEQRRHVHLYMEAFQEFLRRGSQTSA